MIQGGEPVASVVDRAAPGTDPHAPVALHARQGPLHGASRPNSDRREAVVLKEDTKVAGGTSVDTALDAPRQRSARWGPIPSLDGLRALAVLIVVVSHAGYGETIPGGLGVTIFFFLSGYLITTLLLDEREGTGQINIGHFYQRRAFRLLPSLFVTLLVAYVLVGLGRIQGGISWQGVGSQVFYFANYYSIFFDHGGTTPAGTGILWSLAVEEHFYIIFPLLMFAVLRVAGARRFLIGLFVALCVAALLWRSWLVTRPGFDELRTFYATDTRFDSILFGCILALWRNPARSQRDPTRAVMRRVDWLLCAGAAALLLATIMYREPHFRESWRYTLQGLALMPLFYYAILHPATGPFRLLNTRVLARIGVLSYGIYLIHYIVLELVSSSSDVQLPNSVRAALTLAIAIGFAVFLDRVIDPYFRRKRAALR
jgi:peptidoglycan/LPS O-acetylase OafA/YrhL